MFRCSCLCEWEYTHNYYECYDTSRKDVDLFAIVSLSQFDLWGHVCLCASVRPKLLAGLVGCEAQVSHLQVELVVHEDVLQLEVSVHDLLSVHMLKDIEYLAQEEPAKSMQANYILMVQLSQDLNLSVDGVKGILLSPDPVCLDHFECQLLRWLKHALA